MPLSEFVSILGSYPFLFLLSKQFSKGALTRTGEIQYERGRLQNRQQTFARQGPLSVASPVGAIRAIGVRGDRGQSGAIGVRAYYRHCPANSRDINLDRPFSIARQSIGESLAFGCAVVANLYFYQMAFRLEFQIHFLPLRAVSAKSALFAVL
jgi:hypothetical protein